MQRKVGRFPLYNVALTAVVHEDDLHKPCFNQTTAFVLRYEVL